MLGMLGTGLPASAAPSMSPLGPLPRLVGQAGHALATFGHAWGPARLVRYVAEHTGLPALLVAAVLLVVGYRVLKRTARFALEVALVAAALVLAAQLGWIRF